MGGNVKINNLASEFRPSKDLDGTSVADRSLTVSSSAVDLIATALDNNTTHVNIDVQDADVFYTLDGSSPVGGSNGHKIPADSTAIWNIDLANDAKFIRADSTDARIHISELQAK